MKNMNPFLSCYLKMIFSPAESLEIILSIKKKILFGFYAGLSIILLFTITLSGNVIAGLNPIMPPLINIPTGKYYFYELFFQGPVFLSGWILSSGIAYLMCKLFRGSGNFDDTLAALGFTLNIPWIFTWMVDTLIMVLYLTGEMTQAEWAGMITRPGTWMLLNALYPLISLTWSLALVILTLSKIHRLSRLYSIITAVTITLLNQAFMMIFIR